MTPKDRAKVLVDRYKGVAKYGQRQWGQTHYAKQAAIVCVNEILELPTVWFDKSASLEEDGSDTTEYWEEVKQQIEAL